MDDIRTMSRDACEARIAEIQTHLRLSGMPPAQAVILYEGEVEALERRLKQLKRKAKATS